MYQCLSLTGVSTRNSAYEKRRSADRIGNPPPLSRQEGKDPRVDDGKKFFFVCSAEEATSSKNQQRSYKDAGFRRLAEVPKHFGEVVLWGDLLMRRLKPFPWKQTHSR